MHSVAEFVGLLICLAIPLGIAGWLAWLTRRPSRQCPGCSARIYIKAKRCPACGITVTKRDEAEKPNASPAVPHPRKHPAQAKHAENHFNKAR